MVATIQTGGSPGAIGLEYDVQKLYVGQDPAASVAVVDLGLDQRVGTIPTSGFQNGFVTANPVAHRIYVGQQFARKVLVADTLADTPLDNVSIGGECYGVTVDPARGILYVCRSGTTIIPINTTTLVLGSPIGVGEGLVSLTSMGMAVDPDDGTLWVRYFPNQIKAIAGGAVVATVGVGSGPLGVCIGSSPKRVFVANYWGGSVTAYSPADDSSQTAAIGGSPFGIAIDPVSQRLYVANSGGSTVSVLNSQSLNLVETITVGRQPSGIAIDPITHRIYVANNTDGTVSVIQHVNHAPVCEITAPEAVAEGSPSVGLDGTASYDPDADPIVSYTWSQISGPQVVSLGGADTPFATFDAPLIAGAGGDTAVSESYVFNLTVSDGQMIGSCEVRVIVENVNHCPVAQPGLAATVVEGSSFALDGSASSDPDNDPLLFLGSRPVGHRWRLKAPIRRRRSSPPRWLGRVAPIWSSR